MEAVSTALLALALLFEVKGIERDWTTRRLCSKTGG
jgi:hypothetical protein